MGAHHRAAASCRVGCRDSRPDKMIATGVRAGSVAVLPRLCTARTASGKSCTIAASAFDAASFT